MLIGGNLLQHAKVFSVGNTKLRSSLVHVTVMSYVQDIIISVRNMIWNAVCSLPYLKHSENRFQLYYFSSSLNNFVLMFL